MFETKVDLHDKYAMIDRELGFSSSTGELFKMLLSDKKEADSIYVSQRDKMAQYIIQEGYYGIEKLNEMPLDEIYDISKFIETLYIDYTEENLDADTYDGLKAMQRQDEIMSNLRAVRSRKVYDKKKIIF